MTTITQLRTLKLMADYGCFPLWETAEGRTLNVDPRELSISQSLKDALDLWAERYDATLYQDDPIRSGFQDADAEAAFRAEGEGLMRRLQTELGDKYALTSHF